MEMEGRTLGGVGNNPKVKQCMTNLQETERKRSKNPNPNYNKLRVIKILVLKVIMSGNVKLTRSWKNQKFGWQATKPTKQTLYTLHQISIKLTWTKIEECSKKDQAAINTYLVAIKEYHPS